MSTIEQIIKKKRGQSPLRYRAKKGKKRLEKSYTRYTPEIASQPKNDPDPADIGERRR